MLRKFYKKMCLLKAQKIADACEDHVVGTLLDVGAGRAYIAKEIQRRKKNKVQCIDVIDLNETNLPYGLYDGKKIPSKNKSFDSVLLCYVLHHDEDPMRLLNECKRVAKKRIILFEDNPKSLLTKPLDMLFNKLHGVQTPLQFKTIKEWKEIFKKLDLKLIYMERGVEKQWFYPGVEHILFVVQA